MSSSLSFVRGVYQRFDSVKQAVPIVVDVSRSGPEYPEEFRSMVPFTTLHDNVSMYVDQLWQATPEVGGTMLYASFPSFWIDTNRNELDIDADLIEGEWPVPLKPTVSERGLGLLKSKSRYGEPVHERKLTVQEVMERLDNYHRPYHAELARLIEEQRARFGFVYHLSCHCMSAIGAPTHPDAGQARADFCLGDVNGTSASPEFIGWIKSLIEARGYSCAVNWPYSGGEINERYGAPAKGVESIMVEINKKLFMDTKTFRKTDNYGKVQRDVTAILGEVAAKAGELAKGAR